MLSISAVATNFNHFIFMEDANVVIVYNCFDILHAAITHFNSNSFENLVKGVAF